MISIGSTKLPKLTTRVRFPSPAPVFSSPSLCHLPTEAICCRSFTPAQPDRPAASVRDFRSGAYNQGVIHDPPSWLDLKGVIALGRMRIDGNDAPFDPIPTGNQRRERENKLGIVARVNHHGPDPTFVSPDAKCCRKQGSV